MGSTEQFINCPECGYEEAFERIESKYLSIHRFCYRCGYDHHQLGAPGYPTPLLVKDVKSGGNGAVYWKMKGRDILHYAPIEEICMEKLMKQRERYRVEFLEYTYEENGQWFIKDIVTEKTRPYDRTYSYFAEYLY